MSRQTPYLLSNVIRTSCGSYPGASFSSVMPMYRTFCETNLNSASIFFRRSVRPWVSSATVAFMPSVGARCGRLICQYHLEISRQSAMVLTSRRWTQV